MDDSDDYFNDSFVLDDNVLEALQQAETQYEQSSNALEPTKSAFAGTHRDSPPAQKRQRTLPRSDSSSGDDNPDIILERDGTYRVQGVAKSAIDTSGRSASVQKERNAALPSKAVGRFTNNKPVGNVRESVRPPTQHRASNNGPSTSSTPVAGPSRLSKDSSLSGALPVTSANLTPLPDDRLLDEIAQLRTQVEELNRVKMETVEALKKANDARYAREGEITMLRHHVAKGAEEHAADVAKIQATKAAAEAKQAQMDKEHKQAIERLRSEFLFKQHDFQASLRKAPSSVRSRSQKAFPVQSPLPLPATMRAWNSPFIESPAITSTPSKRRTTVTDRGKSPLKQFRAKGVSKLSLPGFENSFLPPSPAKSPTNSRNHQNSSQCREPFFDTTPRKMDLKGKSRQRDEKHSPTRKSPSKPPPPTGRLPPGDDFIQDFDMEISNSSPQQDRRASSPIPLDLGDMSSVIGSDIVVDIEKEQYEYDAFEGINWRDELHFLLFAHSSKVSTSITFQMLLSITLPPGAGDLHVKYQHACANILQALGDKYRYDTLEKLLAVVADATINMLEVLNTIQMLKPLRALMELMTAIIVYIPLYTAFLLDVHESGDKDLTSTLLSVLCSICKSTVPKSINSGPGQDRLELITVTLKVFEAISWTVRDEDTIKLDIICRIDGVLLTLLGDSVDIELVCSTTRLLVLLASHRQLFWALISLPDIDCESDGQPGDSPHIPLPERLNNILSSEALSTQSNRRHAISQYIMDFYSLLIFTNPDGREALLKSNTLAPSLVHYLFLLTTLLWEDENTMEGTTDGTRTTIKAITQGLRLLHLLVFPTPPSNSTISTTSNPLKMKPPYNLRHALYHAPHAQFNGIAHMFVVMIGRLSYADPPEWLDQVLQNDIEQLTDPARDLMELVIEGPEGDAVWAVYQQEDSITEEDDEEMEARIHDI